MQLNLNNITYTYDDAVDPVFTSIHIVFPAGWSGVLGDNGCGKTTLALIAAGVLVPDEGTVTPSLCCAYCPQDSSVVPECLEEFALDWNSSAVRIKTMLGIEADELWDYAHLSGGQKKRVQIGCALWQHPDVLILDEPTNDLDALTRKQICSCLATFKGIGILISHDRVLLDELVNQCVVFENGNVSVRPGGYTKVAQQLQEEFVTQTKAHEIARKEERRLHLEWERRKQEAARSESRLSARKLDKKDSDARERIGRAKVSSKDSIAGRASTVMAGRMMCAQRRTQESRTSKRYISKIHFPGKPVASKSVLHVPSCCINHGGWFLTVPEIWVEPRGHIGIRGRNGAGKTTLLKEICRHIPPQVEWACIPQEVNTDLRHRVASDLHDLDSADMGRVLALVAGLNTDPDQLRKGMEMSPGEMKKILIAMQLLREPNLLILDEPTNHLDIGSVEALQAALAEFPGALVMVSHDEMFLNAICNEFWLVERTGNDSCVFCT